MIQRQKKKCLKCKKDIHPMELHKLVMYVIEDEFTEHYYEHVECPEKFTVWSWFYVINFSDEYEIGN